MQYNPRRQRQLKRIYERDKGICATCGLFVEWRDASRGHIISIAHGGSSKLDNIVLEHRECNVRHGEAPIGVDPAEYAIGLWQFLFKGGKLKTDVFIWALRLLRKQGDAEISEQANEALQLLGSNKIGRIIRLHNKNGCDGLISYSKPRYGDVIYRYPCTACGAEE